MKREILEHYREILNPKKEIDKEFFLDLLDECKQREWEDDHLQAVLYALRVRYINRYKQKIKKAKEEIAEIARSGDYGAEGVRRSEELRALIAAETAEMDTYRPFFDEPYFARMDLVDEIEGYNSYYIGKKGDINLEIVDWRAPVAKKYYQKSQVRFSIREYRYKTVLRRAVRAEHGKLLDFKNEYLSVKDYLSQEEIAGRDEEILFDPYLKQIIAERKEETEIRDIIHTIQEKQYEIITRPERENLVVQGCAGSGKTMILLHRLSYLLYNNEKLQTRDVLVITPSASFNRFIDELSKVLELQSVKTMTIDEYFALLLKGKGIEIPVDTEKREDRNYLEYLYSFRMKEGVQKVIDRTFANVKGLFASDEVQEIVGKIKENCKRQVAHYTAIKNASLRVRRAVLGEIKERPEGGLRYTKPFREFMNAVSGMNEFLSLDFDDEKLQNDEYFVRQLAPFFASATHVYKNADRVISETLHSLNTLNDTVKREIVDLRRYKYRQGGEEILTYADRIERREELLKEIEKTIVRVEEIGDGLDVFLDFYQVVHGDKTLVSLASCHSDIELARYFYRETVKKVKKKYGMEGLYRSDGFAISLILTLLSVPLYPHYGFVFIDEGQDVSPVEYEVVRKNNPTAVFNLFGDLLQNMTPYRGIKRWQDALAVEPFVLNQNYRNVNQIVAFVSEKLGISMTSIGFEGDDVQVISRKGISSFFANRKGLKAVIVSESAWETYFKKSYHPIGKKGNVSKTKINYMTVYESKGLEFSSVVVAEEGMSEQEKYIAYTRALKTLAIIPE